MYENSYAYIPQWLNVQCIDALPKIKLFVQKKIKEVWDVFGVLCALLRCCSPLQCATATIPQHLVPVFLHSPGQGPSPRHHWTQNLCRDTAGRRLGVNWDHCIPLCGEILTLKWSFFGIVRIVSIEEFVLGQRKRNTRGENAKSRRWKHMSE